MNRHNKQETLCSSSHASLISGLSLRLLIVGIPKHTINPLVELIQRWVSCSGEEWTIERVKALKTSLIHLRSGFRPTISLARNRKGEIKGVIGYLMRWALINDSNFYKVVNAFMAYTHWISSKLTTNQRKKFLKAVTSVSKPLPGNLVSLIQRATRQVIQPRTITCKPTSLITWRGSPSKRAPSPLGSVRQNEHLLSELLLTANEGFVSHIKSLWDPIYKSVFEGLNIHRMIDEIHEDRIEYKPMFGGEVHFLQEPGYKLRSIASPFRTFQVASEPLKNDLKDIISELPWDCTHRQDRAFSPIQEAIKLGKTIHSVDLSSATDYFPLELQEVVLSTIYGIGSAYLQLFRDVSRSLWKSDIGVIKWTKGQPLGFGPSFFCFTLTHGLLIYALNGCRWNHDFFVVGDDVVILDDTLYQKYVDTLSLLECPYSLTKSISSNKLAEFAGKIIIKDMVIPQLKWRQVSDDNFLDLAKLVGPRIRVLLSDRQNAVMNVFAHIPDFIHPLGLNWSYPGSNLDKMIKAGLMLTFEETVLQSLTGLSESVHKQLYANYGYFTDDLKDCTLQGAISDKIRTFDEKVLSVFHKLGFSHNCNYENLLEGLASIPETHVETAKSHMLPLKTKQPTRVTLLSRLSRFLIKSTDNKVH